jgi:hypothetical protein
MACLVFVMLAAAPARLRADDHADPPQAGAAAANANSIAPLSIDAKLRFYLKAAYGPVSAFRSFASAGINQAQDYPTEWGQGMRGYGHRFGSKLAQSAVKATIQFGVGAALGEDPRYYPSGRAGLRPRTEYAVTRTFVTRMDNGTSGVAVSRLAGAFGGGLISRTWHPERYRTVGGGMKAGAISLGTDAAFRVLREFWPDIRRALHR